MDEQPLVDHQDKVDNLIACLYLNLILRDGRLEAIDTRLEAIATRLEAITTRLEAIATRLEAIATRFGVIENTNCHAVGGHSY